ncbi:choice-of-anchor D domain-containing protein [Phytohabitans suffuscus]|uniref:Uncharacterized protein n=1 Tax=Phytohabitans suffuscus TaxID=624315 RepID=A0A6F8YRA4_9ACTN|nr:choice-of-anchor D domain-containing protein [Phytohabitans suffuscus]BCB88725.1 hypothetical protein Psuf_060380 [Phytohabitans suffuscus]
MRFRRRAGLVVTVPSLLAAVVLVHVHPADAARQYRYALVSDFPAGTFPTDTEAAVESAGGELADGGRWVVFQARPAGGPWRVFVRDLAGSRTVPLSGADEPDATAPSITADGRLVSYVSSTSDGTRTVVVDRDTDADGVLDEPGGTARYTVTPGVAGLPYQRLPECAPMLGGYEPAAVCPPRLAAGGQAIALPVEVTPDAPLLRFHEIVEGVATAAPTTLVDFGAATGGTVERTIQIQFTGSGPLSLATGTGSAFTVTGTTCTATACTVAVAFRGAVCGPEGPATRFGTLTARGGADGVYGELGLVADCVTGPSGPTTPADCADRSAAGPFPVDVTPPADVDSPGSARVGTVDAAEPLLVSVRVGNLTASAQPVVAHTARPCDFLLVQPETPQDGPAPCQLGVALPVEQTCTAYILVAPAAAGRMTGSLAVGATTVWRLHGSATRHLTVVRTDPTGRGRFTGSAVVASLATGGAHLDGRQMAISADGTALAFVSRDRVDGRPPDPSAGTGAQVYLSVRDPAGGVATGTVTVPPGGTGVLADAASPSISADGARVAFAADAGGGHQVYVHDVGSGATVLVSRRSGTGPVTGGDSFSEAPDLSADGTTVGYVSAAGDLADPPLDTGARRVYIRYLEPDLRGDFGVTERVTEVPANRVSIDRHGRRTAFTAAEPLLAGDDDETDDVYLLWRDADLSVTPTGVDLGSVAVGQSGAPVTVTLDNAGPGPLAVEAVAVDGPFRLVVDGCLGRVLGGEESCAVQVVFTPADAGPATGVLRFTTEGDLVAGDTTVQLTGTGLAAPAAVITYRPDVVVNGQVTRVTGAGLPPNRTVTLRWQPGGRELVVATDAAGRFSLDMVILDGQVPGQYRLVAFAEDGPLATGGVLLLVPGTAQPPDFVRR